MVKFNLLFSSTTSRPVYFTLTGKKFFEKTLKIWNEVYSFSLVISFSIKDLSDKKFPTVLYEIQNLPIITVVYFECILG